MKRSIHGSRLIILTFIVLNLTVWSSPLFAAYPQTMATNAPWINLPRPTDDPRWGKAFSHWDMRGDTEEVMKAIKLFEALAADKPDEMEPQMWLCRSYYLAALRNPSERDQYATLSLKAADNALALSPGNDNVHYWRFASILLYRDLTNAEIAEVREFGKRYRHISPWPVMNDPLFKEVAALWSNRRDRSKVVSLIELLKKIEAENPDQVEPKIWLCVAHYTMQSFEKTEEGQAKWLKIGIEYGDASIAIEPRNPAANFYSVVCKGEYGQKTNALNIARYALDIGKGLQLVVEEDPQYYFGGFARYLAAAIGETGPLVARIADMLGFPEEQIVRITTFAVNLEPDFLDNHTCLAEMYIALDNMPDAKSELLFVINADPAQLPEHEHENRYFQKDAKRLFEEYFQKK